MQGSATGLLRAIIDQTMPTHLDLQEARHSKTSVEAAWDQTMPTHLDLQESQTQQGKNCWSWSRLYYGSVVKFIQIFFCVCVHVFFKKWKIPS